MTTTTVDLAAILHDPAPPAPSRAARDAVHARAVQIRRRRRIAAALATAACVTVAALGTFTVLDVRSGPGARVDAASAPSDAQVAVHVGDAAVPPDVELDATLTGGGGTFRAHVRTPGTLTFADVPAGDYQLRWSWVSDDGTAQAVGHRAVHLDGGDLTLAL
jgi:hypothetical protein